MPDAKRKLPVDEQLTHLDLFMLGVFATLHGGEIPCVPPRVTDTYRRLAKAGLVTLAEDHEEIPNGCDVHNFELLSARITPKGLAVVRAMVGAGRATAAGITLDIPDADVFRRLLLESKP